MDTYKVKSDFEQEAAAGLLQPDQRSTTASSSEEDRLAAGISTIGLQARKLSGAQRKKLIRERKMREGTWTESKPPRKTPTSQDRAASSSGGVKRPHSDSSTPTAEQRQPKKSRSTVMRPGTYKEAATGIKMAIIYRRHPDR
jgi:hypothetical protein